MVIVKCSETLLFCEYLLVAALVSVLYQFQYQAYMSIVWLFEFINNCHFWFQNYFRVTESEVLVLWKNQNQRTINPGYFKNLKEPVVFRKKQQWTHGFMVVKIIKINMTIYQNQFFDCLESQLWILRITL